MASHEIGKSWVVRNYVAIFHLAAAKLDAAAIGNSVCCNWLRILVATSTSRRKTAAPRVIVDLIFLYQRPPVTGRFATIVGRKLTCNITIDHFGVFNIKEDALGSAFSDRIL